MIVILVLTVIASVSLFAPCAFVLRYAEGWTTFYWDCHYVAEMLSDKGVGELVRAFLLQFYAEPVAGITLVTVIAVIVALLSMMIVHSLSKKPAMLYLSLLPALAVPLMLLAFLSPNGISVLTMRFSDA